ncbi:hypothetical protein AHOG_02330 [Actinoalloteichus hoggarensis]|uniref:Uncharacterized protein n=1 Tax=Actinoalloteichus hoggarensis TaxID=1470176 RepID=A0A221VX48_9PSEU|nr:hypothetical protein AHOG_02330 [Actinoalloteichus hoggarensis]
MTALADSPILIGLALGSMLFGPHRKNWKEAHRGLREYGSPWNTAIRHAESVVKPAPAAGAGPARRPLGGQVVPACPPRSTRGRTTQPPLFPRTLLGRARPFHRPGDATSHSTILGPRRRTRPHRHEDHLDPHRPASAGPERHTATRPPRHTPTVSPGRTTRTTQGRAPRDRATQDQAIRDQAAQGRIPLDRIPSPPPSVLPISPRRVDRGRWRSVRDPGTAARPWSTSAVPHRRTADSGTSTGTGRHRPAPERPAVRSDLRYRVRRAVTTRQGVGEPTPSIPESLSLERRPRREPSVPADRDRSAPARRSDRPSLLGGDLRHDRQQVFGQHLVQEHRGDAVASIKDDRRRHSGTRKAAQPEQ